MTAQVKFTTDGYPGGYANGLSMLDSDTMGRFKVSVENERETVLETENEITLRCSHEQVKSLPVRRWFPFVALEDSTSGRFVAVMLYAPSSWQMEIFVRRQQEVTLAGGIADADFGQWTKTLAPGECFTAPRALVAEGSSLLEVCDAQTPDIRLHRASWATGASL